MNKVEQAIQKLQQELQRWRGKSLKETPTRTAFIEPLLEALGWDVRDLDEVEPEYTTVDGKPVDYALKINRKPIIYLEAKPLDDDLDDVKSVTQIVNYANADGLDWCVLTNGVRYRVYRSSERTPAPEKLLFECSFGPKDNASSSTEDIARVFERLSKEAMAEGRLDTWGKKVINYLWQGKIFCSVHLWKSGLRIWVKLNYGTLVNPPDFVRDVSKIGHWGVGNTESL